jgi:cyanate permease
LQFSRTIRLLWTFYSGFCFASILITGVCLFLYWEYGDSIYDTLICFKLLTLLAIYFFINSYKQDQFYYYRNLKLTKWMLWTAAFAFDIALYVLLLTRINPVT